jgi:hypothetical protein
MKQVIFSFCLACLICSSGCSQSNYMEYNGKTWEQLNGSGKLVKLNPTINAFTKIEVDNMNVKVQVQTGADKYAMNVDIDDNLASFFKWKQEGSTLKLSFDVSGGKYPRWLSGNNTVITITAPVVEAVANNGNGKLEINLNGPAAFSLVNNGNSNISLTGKVAKFNLQSTGNAGINAGSLAADKIILSTNGNANIEVNTKELVEQSINGNNDITNIFYGAKKEKTSNDYIWSNDESNLIDFKLKNNSLLPAKLTVISYRPNEKGNGTRGFVIGSYGSRTLKFPAGTKIYLANSEQVNIVMSGKKITDQTPFLIVKEEDEGKIFNIK